VKAVVWEPPAREELDNALSISRDPNAFQQAIDEALRDIANGTIAHAQVPRTPARRCILMTLPYSIIYTETDDEIRVWAFPHHKRRTGYWKRRLCPN
jgi:ParE toxin of type II toxin-antitoxin system, parDE